MKRGPKPQPRLPLAPLERYVAGGRPESSHSCHEVPNGSLADVVGVGVDTVKQWRKRGVPLYQADRSAVHLGSHPALIWAGWFAIQPEDTDDDA